MNGGWQHTCTTRGYFTSGKVLTAHNHDAVRIGVNGNDFGSKGDWDSVVLHPLRSPGKVVGILLAGRNGTSAVDKVDQTVLAVQVGQEGNGGLRRTQSREVLHETDLHFGIWQKHTMGIIPS